MCEKWLQWGCTNYLSKFIVIVALLLELVEVLCGMFGFVEISVLVPLVIPNI